MRDEPKAPMPWFGGKRRVAPLVWAALGDVQNYVEPFAGSLAVLLGRPAEHHGRTETVNDADCYLANFWRALSLAPEEVARCADWPVNECDLVARHLWLVNEGKARIARMEADPDFYDAKVAGWWVWGINSWIGSGWCSGTGPWQVVDGELRKRPHLGDAGRGVNRKLPRLGSRGKDKPGRETDCDALIGYFNALAARLRGVRVCCGDWARTVTRGALSFGSTVGVFLDPPYSGDVRAADLYSTDDHGIAVPVREWCIANGNDPRMRIVLAGYEAEHAEHMPADWRMVAWKANAAYQGHDSGDGANKSHRKQERLWLSPHCLRAGRLL
jgi:hypothetical protein